MAAHTPAPPNVLLITGAGRGIGAATALAAAAAGWDIGINYRSDDAAAQRVAQGVRAQGRRALLLPADVADADAVAAMFRRCDDELGPLGGLVNNAGIVAPAARVDEMDPSRIARVLAVNVGGAFHCAREAVRRMSTRHGGTGGVIVNVSSIAATLSSPATYVDYAASKAAIDNLTKGLAREIGAEGVRVNGVRPGLIDTEIHASGSMADRLPAAVLTVPMQRIGTADEVAQAIVWLLSPAASYVHGATLDVGGGR
jgi:NAD(P)-dependent dehydrogenase (short-subunit alcohol dehydrogenase family)